MWTSHIRYGRGRRITSLGVLYDFTGNDVNTTVQSVANMVKEQWVSYHRFLMISTGYSDNYLQFTEAIAEEPDVFVLVG